MVFLPVRSLMPTVMEIQVLSFTLVRTYQAEKNISRYCPFKSFVTFKKKCLSFLFAFRANVTNSVSDSHLLQTSTLPLILKSLGQPISQVDPDQSSGARLVPKQKNQGNLLVFKEINALSGGTAWGRVHLQSKIKGPSYLPTYGTSPQNRFPNRFDTCFQSSLQTLGLNHCFRWATYNEGWCFQQCYGSGSGRIRDFSARWYPDPE